jgi:hypothetical protein
MNLKSIKNWLFKNDVKTIIIIWFIVEFLCYIFYGFNFTLEGEKYINEASYFTENKSFSQARFLFYSTTIFIIAFAKVVFNNLNVALLILLAINLFCYLQFYKALKIYFKEKKYPILIIVALLCFLPFQSWTMYLYTENIFYSLIILLFAHILKGTCICLSYVVKLFIITSLLLLSRPLGILFLLPIFLFLFIQAKKKERIILSVASILGLFVFYYISQVVFTTTPDWTVQRSFMEENLICDVPTVKQNTSLDVIQSTNQLKVLWYYITHNFIHFIGLAFARLKLFFLLVRNYYSTMHNAFLLLIIIPMYLVLILGIKKINKNISSSLKVFLASCFLLFAISIAMQCDDYHNRFFLCLLPFFFFLVAVVLRNSKNYFFRNTQ